MEKQISNDWDHIERIVSFETAKLAKELGFPQYIYAMKWYNKNGESSDKPFGTDIKAPRQSILQKWLREQFIVDIEINVYTRPDYHSKFIDRYANVHRVYNPIIRTGYEDHPEAFNSFEEAFERALFQALLFIKEN
jgi:hypothetical protein